MHRSTLRSAVLIGLLALVCPLAGQSQTPVGDAPEDPRARARRAASEPGLTEEQETLIDRPDRKRPDDPICVDVFGRALCLGGRAQLRTRMEVDRLNDFDYEDVVEVTGDPNLGRVEDRIRGQHPTQDRLRHESQLTANAFYSFTDNILMYLEGRVSSRFAWNEHARDDHNWVFERDETWIYFGNMFGSNFSLQAGRHKWTDEREWFWDQDLDSVRLRYDLESFHAEVGVGQELFGTQDGEGIDPEEEDLLRILFATNYEWSRKNTIGLYALHEHDTSSRLPFSSAAPDITGTNRCTEFDVVPPFTAPPNFAPDDLSGCLRSRDDDESDARLTWVGAAASGRGKTSIGRFKYFFNVAGVFGDETFSDISTFTVPSPVDGITPVLLPGNRRLLPGDKNHHDVRGWGLDVTGSFEFDVPLKPRVTLGYAFGSGGDSKRGDGGGAGGGETGPTPEFDTGFRQSVLADNTDKWFGVDAFRFYGELANPNLSNMHIVTAALGFPLLRDSSVEFIWHYYAQAKPAEFVRDWRIGRDPNGRDRPDRGISYDRELGWELDVILGLEEWEALEIELVGALFQAGNALDVRPNRSFSFARRDRSKDMSWMFISQIRYNF